MIELKVELRRRMHGCYKRVDCYLADMRVDHWREGICTAPTNPVEKACKEELEKWIAEEREPLTKGEIAALRALLKKESD